MGSPGQRAVKRVCVCVGRKTTTQSINQSINPEQPTCGGTVVADAEASVRDDLVADKLEVETIAVRANETVYRASAVRADQRRRSETAISTQQL